MLWAVYLAAIPVVTIWAMLSGWRSDRPELTRCGAVALVHAAIVNLAMLIWPPIAGEGYPFVFLTLALVGALWLICRIPAGKQCALLAGGTVQLMQRSEVAASATVLQASLTALAWRSI